MVKLSLFMLINQGYYKIQDKTNYAQRLFGLFLEGLSMYVMFVQFFLLYLLWTQGLTIEKSTTTTNTTAFKYPNMTFIAKPKDLGAIKNIEFAMVIAIMIVYILIGMSLLEHMKVIASMKEYLGLMRQTCYLFEFVLHFIAIVFQCLYALLLAYYSFFVIWQS